MRKFLFLAVITFCSASAFAWPACSGSWNQVPSGTSSANGIIYSADGLTWQCQTKTTPPPPPVTPPTSITNTNTSNSTSSSSSSSNSNASSTATGGSSKATGGNSVATGGAGGSSKSNATGGAGGNGGAGGTGGSVGAVTATGGNSAGGAGGNATGGNATGGKVANSGNSANTNKNTAQGGKGGASTVAGSGNSKQGQSQSTNSAASNNGTGDGNNANDSVTNVAAAQIPVSTAYAPTAIPTAPCLKGYGGGGQTATAGFSFGGSKVDENCAILETARSFGISGSRLAYCKTMLTDKYAKKAGITLEDCMAHESMPAPIAPIALPPLQPTIIVVPMPAPLPVAVIPAVPEPVLEGVCSRLDNECKAMLDDATNWEKNSQGVIVIYGSLTTYPTANAMRVYLKHNGLTDEDVRVSMSDKSTPVIGLGYLQR